MIQLINLLDDAINDGVGFLYGVQRVLDDSSALCLNVTERNYLNYLIALSEDNINTLKAFEIKYFKLIQNGK